jgi:hypothetical protein
MGSGVAIDHIMPPRGRFDLELNAISCVSESFCVAAGDDYLRPTTQRGNSSSSYPATAIWNGTNWTVHQSPSAGPNIDLEQVSCSSRANCLAIGGEWWSGNGPLLEHFNGTRWSKVLAPKIPGISHFNYDGLAVVTPSEILVVGSVSSASKVNVTLIAEYNGKSLKLLQD